MDEHYVPQETETDSDFQRNQFLDLRRPLIMQVWHANFSKAFYLKQVHQPRYLPQPARLFGPWYLEMFTRTSWWVVPAIWLPVAFYLAYLSVGQQATFNEHTGDLVWGQLSALRTTCASFLLGNFVWTLLEYAFHRFLFHLDDFLPDHRAFLLLHFLNHGIHHYLPYVVSSRLVLTEIKLRVYHTHTDATVCDWLCHPCSSPRSPSP